MKKILDQFYTNPKVSDHLVYICNKHIKDFNKFNFIEPSAGTGNFVDSLAKFKITKVEAYDIDPKSNGIKKADYLKVKKRFMKNRIIIGNPPFGKRSKLAISFINKAFEHGSYVAMILPRQFNRYLTQKKINEKARLIYSKNIENDAFILNDKRYDVKCVFQIWSLYSIKKNIRLLSPEARTHKDFETRIHNNTESTLKFFDKKYFKWNYAIHRQGFYNYNKVFYHSSSLKKNRQYFFIKIINPIAKDIIKKIDFEKLSHTNTQTPGFSTTDFVKEYSKQKRMHNGNKKTSFKTK